MKTHTTKAGFTPGPWTASPSNKLIIGGDGLHVAEIIDDGMDTSTMPCFFQGNAALIAAAPELLEALQAIIAEADGGWLHESPIAKQATDAIQRATGETI